MNDIVITQARGLSLGEGNTPLVRLSNLEAYLNWNGELWAKAEYQNPTGSFKDRGSFVEVNRAIQLGKTGVVCASTGNMAASLSAYATRAKLNCTVVVPANTPIGKLRQALTYGAQLIKVDGSYDQCVEKAEVLVTENNWLLCGDYELRRIGQRSLGRELARSGLKVDAFVVPVGDGTVGCAVYEGLVEKNQRARFIGVQGEGSAPLITAWKTRQPIVPLNNPQTIASAMRVGKPLDGELTLKYVGDSNGDLVAVSDDEIIQAQALLALQEGIWVESAAAATVAVIIQSQTAFKNNVVVLVLTGSGLKEGGA